MTDPSLNVRLQAGEPVERYAMMAATARIAAMGTNRFGFPIFNVGLGCHVDMTEALSQSKEPVVEKRG
jgi:hypothetical protein